MRDSEVQFKQSKNLEGKIKEMTIPYLALQCFLGAGSELSQGENIKINRSKSFLLLLFPKVILHVNTNFRKNDIFGVYQSDILLFRY